MLNLVLWALDNQTDPLRFERLCVDLLSREGYANIVPIGGVHDRGRDAEIRDTDVTFFQFSLEEGWLSKLRRELRKVHDNGHQIEVYVFITTQKVTGRKRDSLVGEVKQNYNWELKIYDREWLRNRLEEQHPDLATKYLGLPLLGDRREIVQIVMPAKLSEDVDIQLGEHYFDQGNYEAAIVEFRKYANMYPLDDDVWNLLAYCQYHLNRFDDAMESINYALKQKPDEPTYLMAKAAILAEDGIYREDRVKLQLARDILAKFAAGSAEWIDHYNYANVLGALGEFEDAKREYLQGVDLKSDEPELWNNLGNTYFQLDQYGEALKCFDRALEIDPNLPQALASKGVLILLAFDKPDEAIPFLERAMKLATGQARWHQGWYWLGLAYIKLDTALKALECLNEGLAIMPSNLGLLNLKAGAYLMLRRSDANSSHVDEALEFFEFLHKLETSTFDTSLELAQLYLVKKRVQDAVRILKPQYDIPASTLEAALDLLSGYTVYDLKPYLLFVKHSPIYKRFRERYPISDYTSTLSNGGLALPDGLADQLFIAASVPFSMSYEALQDTKLPIEERLLILQELYAPVLKYLKEATTKVYRQLLSQAGTPSEKQIVALKTFVASFVTGEWACQLHWIAGRLRMPIERVTKVFDDQSNNENSAISKFINDLYDFIRDDMDIDQMR